MRLLLDIRIGRTAATKLRGLGHDVSWLAEWSVDPGDDEILLRARTESRILSTLDNDFGELAVLHRQQHRGIMRLVDVSAMSQSEAIVKALDRYRERLMSGAIVTVEPVRTRIRDPET